MSRWFREAGSPHCEQIAWSLSTYSAVAMSCGSGSNGSPRNVWSVPETITRVPASASALQASTSASEKKFASSIATTSGNGSSSRMSRGPSPSLSTTVAFHWRPVWLPIVVSP